MAKKKKKIKPYVTSNPNDPRIQAYRDSLALYNNSNKSSFDFLTLSANLL